MSTGTANCLFLLKPHMHAGMNCYNLQDSTDQYNFVTFTENGLLIINMRKKTIQEEANKSI